MSYISSALFVLTKIVSIFFGIDQTNCQSVCEVMIGNEHMHSRFKWKCNITHSSFKLKKFDWWSYTCTLAKSLNELFWLPVVCCPSLCSFVNFSHFSLLLQNQWTNFNQTWHKASLSEGDSIFIPNEGSHPFLRGDKRFIKGK